MKNENIQHMKTNNNSTDNNKKIDKNNNDNKNNSEIKNHNDRSNDNNDVINLVTIIRRMIMMMRRT